MCTLMWLHYQQYLLNVRFQLCALTTAESSKYICIYFRKFNLRFSRNLVILMVKIDGSIPVFGDGFPGFVCRIGVPKNASLARTISV